MDFSPEQLLLHPDRLTHRKAPNEDPRAWDGLYGAVITDLETVLITTPNASYIPAPPLGVNREMAMYSNYRYSDDDHLCWPQPYSSTRPYLTCIHTTVCDDDDPDAALYALPKRSEFEEFDLSSVIRGPGLWFKECYEKLKTCCDRILEACTAHANPLPTSSFLEERRRLLPMFLERIESLPLTFECLRLCVAETQRLALELRAYIDYYRIYRPRMDTNASRTNFPANVRLAGTFTTSLTVAQELQRAGIPVWLLRSVSVVPVTRIDRVISITRGEEVLDQHQCPLRLREVFVGAATDDNKYLAFENFTRSHFSTPNPFLWTPGVRQGFPLLPTPPTESSVRYEPYTAPKKRKETRQTRRGEHRFTVVEHPCLPPINSAWQAALLTVDTNPTRTQMAPAGYAFPRPDLFVAVQTEAKMKMLLLGWLQLRAGLYALLAPPFTPMLLPHQTWRTVLQFDWLEDHQNHESTSIAVNVREAKWRERAQTFLAGCNGEMSLVEGKPRRPKWRGIDIEKLSIAEIQAILWEVNEVAFRLEMIALNSRMCTLDSDDTVGWTDVKRLLGLCFPPHKFDLCWIVMPGSANHGLTDPVWINRAPYLCALRRVMLTWHSPPAEILQNRHRYGAADIERLETAITKYYADSFFLQFNRAPILPRNLACPLTSDWEPQPRDTVLGDHSGVYVDVSLWEDGS